MSDLKLLFENYLKSSYRTTPVRSPFSQTNYYTGGKVDGGGASWKDYTDLYNTTYRTHFQKDGFERVMYNNPLNIMIMFPFDEAEGFETIEEDAVVQFGLKTARGFRKDYRFLDMSIPGAGRVAVDEEAAEQLLNEPFETLREVRPTYTRNLGEVPVERLDESASADKQEGKRLAIRRKIADFIQKELEEELDRTLDVSLNESERAEVIECLSERQLHEGITVIENELCEAAVRQIEQGGKLSIREAKEVQRALKQASGSEVLSESIRAKLFEDIGQIELGLLAPESADHEIERVFRGRHQYRVLQRVIDYAENQGYTVEEPGQGAESLFDYRFDGRRLTRINS